MIIPIIRNVYQNVVMDMENVKENMIVVVKMDIVELVKNFVILLMDVNQNLVFVDVVTMTMINV